MKQPVRYLAEKLAFQYLQVRNVLSQKKKKGGNLFVVKLSILKVFKINSVLYYPLFASVNL